MPEVPAPVTALARKAPAPVRGLARRTAEPLVAQTLRSTAAAVISYVLAVNLLPQPAPLTAPLTALLVVQVTLFATIRTGIRRVNAVIAGVLIASGFSSLVGLTWWSLGLTIVTALVIGRIVRVGEFVPEVAISAMLVLGVSQVANTALDRVYETLIGAGVGLAFNLFLAPPVYVRTANEAITAMARRSSRLYNEVALQVGEDYNAPRAADWLHAARRLDNDIAEVDEELRQAEESTRLNPRVREGLLNRVVLRTGLDTLEICAVVQRVQFRTLTDLAAKRPGRRPLPEEAADSYARLLLHMGSAVESFAALITTPLSTGAEDAEDALTRALDASHAERDHLAALLLDLVRTEAAQWQLYGALLAEADRILDELDVEKRSARLIEELDRITSRQRERYPRLAALRSRLRNGAPRPRGRGGGRGGGEAAVG
ncbi:aromatic acid exporter family protein [Streptomyces sp. SID11385]|uniref:FUSC family protein n=1 Tax=Streptomyces sp. SID11385 TaxID=2706031 RepID=UPI0013CD2189|nr:aromatic acid exporter family protein [Streptomyces sp. SID11385]NEA40618.1 hypothetical protein [Streptomyces sp. SID11385]